MVASHDKILVVGAVEVLAYNDTDGTRKERAGRVRFALIPVARKESLGRFVERNVDPGSRVRTEGWPGYSARALADFMHHIRVIGRAQRAHKRLHHIHRAFGNLNTWLSGTHQGVEPKHRQSYLDGYDFRYNRRKTPRSLSDIRKHENFGARIWLRINDLDSATV